MIVWPHSCKCKKYWTAASIGALHIASTCRTIGCSVITSASPNNLISEITHFRNSEPTKITNFVCSDNGNSVQSSGGGGLGTTLPRSPTSPSKAVQIYFADFKVKPQELKNITFCSYKRCNYATFLLFLFYSLLYWIFIILFTRNHSLLWFGQAFCFPAN